MRFFRYACLFHAYLYLIPIQVYTVNSITYGTAAGVTDIISQLSASAMFLAFHHATTA
jgi:hypothetical protein